MKKIIVMIILLVIMSSSAFALEVNLSVKLNDNLIKSDQKNILVNDTAFIVARSLTDALGYEIKWNEESNSVMINTDNKKLEIKIDSNIVLVDGKEVKIKEKSFVRNGRTYIPLRIVAEYLGCEVTWVQETYTVELVKDNFEVDEKYIAEEKYSKEDLKLLSKIVQIESSDSSIEMKLAIANVVLNRVKDSRFPNTVSDVIYQKDVHVQFPPAHRESFKTLEPSIYSKIAAKNALEGENNIGNSLFFNNRPFKSKADDLYKVIEGEYFYK